MRRFVAALSLIAMAQASFAGAFVCEKYINKYGLLSDRNCVYHSELNPNIVTPHKDGDIKRIQVQDERVFVERYGRDGQEEEWHESSKGEWVRMH